MNANRPAGHQIVAFASAAITTLALLAGLAGQADRTYASERVAQDAAATVQQVVVVGSRVDRS